MSFVHALGFAKHSQGFKNNVMLDDGMNKKTISLILFIVGIILALTGATLMFLGVLPLAARITIGIVGIGLIGASNFGLLGKA